jgi:hypothetical protein
VRDTPARLATSINVTRGEVTRCPPSSVPPVRTLAVIRDHAAIPHGQVTIWSSRSVRIDLRRRVLNAVSARTSWPTVSIQPSHRYDDPGSRGRKRHFHMFLRLRITPLMVCDHTEAAWLTAPTARSSLWLTRFSRPAGGFDRPGARRPGMGDRPSVPMTVLRSQQLRLRKTHMAALMGIVALAVGRLWREFQFHQQ